MKSFIPLIALVLCLPCFSSQCQILDESFAVTVASAEQGRIYSGMVKQADGKIIVTGFSRLVNGKFRPGIIRLNADLTLDETYKGVVNPNNFFSQNNLVLQQDGKLIVGNALSPVISANIARFATDGSIDATFHTGTGFNTSLRATAIDQNNKILVLGYFSSYDNSDVQNLVRLNSDGSLDKTFALMPGFQLMEGNTYEDISMQADGKILLSAYGFRYEGMSVSNVIRLNNDGTLDNTFNYIADANDIPICISPQSNGKIILINRTKNSLANNRGNAIRLNADGSLDNTFTKSAFTIDPRGAAFQADNKIVIGGNFGVVRLKADGTVDNTYAPSLPASIQNGSLRGVAVANNGDIIFSSSIGILHTSSTGVMSDLALKFQAPGIVYDFIVKDDGNIVIGGAIDECNGQPAKNVLTIDKNGGISPNFNYFSDAPVDLLVPYDDEFIAADVQAGDDVVPGPLRVNSNGSADETFNAQLSGNTFDGRIDIVKKLSTEKTLIGGAFNSYKGLPNTKGLVRLNVDGSLDNSFTTPASLNDIIGVEELHDGKLLISDLMPNFVDSLRMLTADGSVLNAFKIGINNTASFMKEDYDGNIFVGGFFSTINNINRNGFIKIVNGKVDESFNSPITSVTAFEIQRDKKMLLGNYDGKITRINTDGTIDNTFAHTFLTGTLGRIKIHQGDIYACGSFVESSSPLRTGIIRFTSGISTPTDLKGDASATSTTITWTGNSSGATNFIIERADNVSGIFQELATTNATAVSYQDNDLSSNTSYSYRIKAVNAIGESGYSKTLTLKTDLVAAIAEEMENTLSLYPNPAINELSIELNNAYRGDLHIDVIDMMGKRVSQNSSVKKDQHYTSSLLLTAYPTGVYVIKVGGNGFSFCKKIIKK